jgi:thiol-disulfide isomerase/thioredoxin
MSAALLVGVLATVTLAPGETPGADGRRPRHMTSPVILAPSAGGLSSLTNGGGWINSPPLTATDLCGKVVLIDFWTYTCVNWRRTLPYVRAWANKYKDRGLVVVGVHSPEFPFEKDVEFLDPGAEAYVFTFG